MKKKTSTFYGFSYYLNPSCMKAVFSRILKRKAKIISLGTYILYIQNIYPFCEHFSLFCVHCPLTLWGWECNVQGGTSWWPWLADPPVLGSRSLPHWTIITIKTILANVKSKYAIKRLCFILLTVVKLQFCPHMIAAWK